MDSEIARQMALVAAVGILSATLYGIAALWAVGGRANWFWRIAPLALLWVAWVPAGAYELLALFGTQAAVVVGVVLCLQLARRLRKGWRATAPVVGAAEMPEPGDGRAVRFSLKDIIQAVSLTAAVLAMARLHAPGTAALLGLRIEWVLWCASGAGAGLVTLAASYLVCGHPDRWYVRAIVVVLLTALGGVLEMAFVGSNVFNQLLVSLPPGWILACGLLQAIATAAWLRLIAAAGYAWWTNPTAAAAADPAPSGSRETGSLQLVRLSARAAACGLSLSTILILGRAYVAVLPPRAIPQSEMPSPYEYNELLRAASLFDWTAIPNQDIDAASSQDCQSFVENNRAALKLLRKALKLPCRVPVHFSGEARNIYYLLELSYLVRGLGAEAKASLAVGHPEDAVQSYFDMIRLGQNIAHGGLMVDDLVADETVEIGLDGVVGQLGNIDTAGLEQVTRSLEPLVDVREPVDSILARDRLWSRLRHGWIGWLASRVGTRYGCDTSSEKGVLAARARINARLRLAICEASARRYTLKNGHPPESLASLVPNYLSAVPQDPYSDQPLIYRRTGDSYLLYSVAANRTDDGGQRVSLDNAVQVRIGDLFFDAQWAP